MGTPILKSNPKARDLRRVETGAGQGDAIGEASLLCRMKVALICSQKCPGDVILKTYDFARLVRGSGIAVVSGFHSPIEKDCLPILLRGPGPVIIVQGHRLSGSRLPREWQKVIDAGRLLLLSPFVAAVSDRRRRSESAATTPNRAKRVTAKLAAERNRFVAAISDEVLVPYAAPGSKTEALALDLLKSSKRIYTFSDRPGPLLDAGAKLIAPDFFISQSAAVPRKATLARGTS
ncbi:MAG TPA: hypothetical protein VI455_16485 [Terriglobia bacterium]